MRCPEIILDGQGNMCKEFEKPWST